MQREPWIALGWAHVNFIGISPGNWSTELLLSYQFTLNQSWKLRVRANLASQWLVTVTWCDMADRYKCILLFYSAHSFGNFALPVLNWQVSVQETNCSTAWTHELEPLCRTVAALLSWKLNIPHKDVAVLLVFFALRMLLYNEAWFIGGGGKLTGWW